MKTNFQEHHLFQALRRFENQTLPLDLFLNGYFRSNKALGSKDRKFIAENAYGMIRWLLLIDHCIAPSVSWETRYKFYTSHHPEQHLNNDLIPLHVRTSFPEELFSFLIAEYGREKSIELCLALNTEAPTTIRVNPLKCSRDVLFDQWEQKYGVTKCEYSPFGIKFKERHPLLGLQEFKDGLFEIQDEASQLVSLLVKPRPGNHVLDFCAGSGGKTLAFAHCLEGRGQLYLHDIRPKIQQEARKRLKRAGIQNAQFVLSNTKHLLKLKKKMDWIITDVPCTGTGTLRRQPDQKWMFSEELLNRLVLEQRSIFDEALSYLKPGGKIIYATCSILKAENQSQVAYFLSHYPIKLISEPFISLPTRGGMDGFFAATFEHLS